ncbi:MAG: ribosomal subunit interface protein [Candidatus Spechtbacteria bacterium RIFCSPLOWO2_01_FULL_43_12]|uniref:Ribosomal subunit interface protein n=1 Tax=Candidatus Spechtbacteria bacterium RIFCSPLOWO2_01_FULL_43_12 TaxID=1802162 RepID=A0A1G2HEE1_9BACT|nr:MAG: ribosomal subunit interface protein [Candidatus Spechtbacteria bacterium RIFCSPLOWO2_01_FULL_43_12]
MQINIKATNMELTNAVRKYVTDKVGELEKYIQAVDNTAETGQRSAVVVDVEIGRTSKHHRKGDVYRAEINVSLPGEKHVLRTESEQWDLHVAIDEAKDEMQSRMKKYRSKRTDSFDRGKRAWKKLIRLSGLAKRDTEE